MSGNAGNESNPIHLWTGMCTSPCGAALRHKSSYVDLSGLARIRWNTKMSGFHQVRPIVKLADGTWLVGDKADGSPTDWLVTEISFADVTLAATRHRERRDQGHFRGPPGPHQGG